MKRKQIRIWRRQTSSARGWRKSNGKWRLCWLCWQTKLKKTVGWMKWNVSQVATYTIYLERLQIRKNKHYHLTHTLFIHTSKGKLSFKCTNLFFAKIYYFIAYLIWYWTKARGKFVIHNSFQFFSSANPRLS